MSFKATPCGIENCKSNLFHDFDGHVFCANGHQQEGLIQLETDDTVGVGTRRRKSVKTNAIKCEEEKIWHGSRGTGLYLQCLQQILRKQIKWLISNDHAVEDIEAIALELFGLYLTACAKANEIKDCDDNGNEERDTQPLNHHYHPSNLENIRDMSTQLDVDYITSKPKGLMHPHLSITVIICYLALLKVRTPVFLADFINWMKFHQFPYVQALQHCDSRMTAHLSAAHCARLTISRLPSAGSLQERTHAIAVLLFKSLTVTLPLPNVPQLLIRQLRDLILPRELII